MKEFLNNRHKMISNITRTSKYTSISNSSTARRHHYPSSNLHPHHATTKRGQNNVHGSSNEEVGGPAIASLEFDGVSLKSTLLDLGFPLPNRTGIFAISAHGPVNYAGATLITGKWKIIKRFALPVNRTSLYELYNLDDDIGEDDNLVDKYPVLMVRLAEALDRFIEDTDSLVPINNPRYNHSEAVELGLAS